MRIQKTKEKREQKKKELNEPVEVASVELPSFDFSYNVLADNNLEEKTERDLFSFEQESDHSIFNWESSSVISHENQSQHQEDENESWISVHNKNQKKVKQQERAKRLEEERQEKLARIQEEKDRKERLRKEKKEQIRQKMIQNAEEGKLAKRRRHEAYLKEKQDKIQKIKDEKEAKERSWREEQERRRLAWEQQKIIRKQEKKERKVLFKQQKNRILAEDKDEKGRKIFVGKATFDDIMADESCNEFLKEELKDGRKQMFHKLFSTFGAIEKLKPNWEKGYFFVVYHTCEEAQKAFAALSSFSERKNQAASIRRELKKNLGDVRKAPLPMFYVRWPGRDKV